MIYRQVFGHALACLQAKLNKCSLGQHSLTFLCQQQCAVVHMQMHMHILGYGHEYMHMHILGYGHEYMHMHMHMHMHK